MSIDTKRTVEWNNILLNNSHVVPRHHGLLVKYQAHINVEWEPFVQRLYFHLENKQEVRFHDNDTVPEIVRKKLDVDGHMVYAHPTSGEKIYMRLLLNFVTGPMDFKDIRTVDGVVCPIYKEAYFQRGLLESDKEWHIVLDDASICASPSHIRDYLSLLLKIDVADKQMLAPKVVNNILKRYGKKLVDYPKLNVVSTSKYRNEFLIEEMMYDREELRLKADNNCEHLNQRQCTIYETIIGLNYNGDPMDAMVAEVYGDLRQRHGDIKYLRDRAILTPLNEFVDYVNNHVL
ncbi:hypothetical protein AgCh_018822 [Apium graveolens]